MALLASESLRRHVDHLANRRRQPGSIALRNFPKDSLVVGMEISMTVYPAKNGETLADGGTITFPDGKRLFFGGSAPVDGLDKDGKPCIIRRSNRQPAVDCRR